jgi:hypothetical protein
MPIQKISAAFWPLSKFRIEPHIMKMMAKDTKVNIAVT